ncbi:MAG: hypothetical protein ABIR11_09595, partial [Candidatus Limnocylindrales bacterium]
MAIDPGRARRPAAVAHTTLREASDPDHVPGSATIEAVPPRAARPSIDRRVAATIVRQAATTVVQAVMTGV